MTRIGGHRGGSRPVVLTHYNRVDSVISSVVKLYNDSVLEPFREVTLFARPSVLSMPKVPLFALGSQTCNRHLPYPVVGVPKPERDTLHSRVDNLRV